MFLLFKFRPRIAGGVVYVKFDLQIAPGCDHCPGSQFCSLLALGSRHLELSKKREKGIFVECKFTSKPMPYDEYEDLKTAMSAFGDVKEKYMYFISRSGFTDSVSKAAEKDGARLLTVDDLFRD